MLRVNNIKYVDTLEQQNEADEKVRDVMKNTIAASDGMRIAINKPTFLT